MINAPEKHLLPEEEFIAGFHAIGEERYHYKHPFHTLMHEGALSRGQLQAWALNRYYYQANIPRKDAALLARTDDHTFRTAFNTAIQTITRNRRTAVVRYGPGETYRVAVSRGDELRRRRR